MYPASWLRCFVVALHFFVLLAVTAKAQNVLLTEYGGKYLPVMKAVAERPYVLASGQLKRAPGSKYALRKVDDYLPVFVAIRDFKTNTHAIVRDGNAMNHMVVLSAQLESTELLKDVFVVLEMDGAEAGKILYLTEVGELKPRKARDILVETKIRSSLGPGKFTIHLFSEGMEVLHSHIDASRRDEALDEMTVRRIAKVQDAAPRLLMGPEPEYPAALIKTKASGQVVVSIRIGANGRVYDAVVKQATDPVLAESALAAVRLWRFLPQVRGGRAVETRADMPIDFVPPETSPGKS